jgi:hypothetical protein
MIYGLTLSGTRVLSAGRYHHGIPEGVTVVDNIPDDDISSYDFIDGKFIKNEDYVAELEAAKALEAALDNRPTVEQRIKVLEDAIQELRKDSP